MVHIVNGFQRATEAIDFLLGDRCCIATSIRLRRSWFALIFGTEYIEVTIVFVRYQSGGKSVAIHSKLID